MALAGAPVVEELNGRTEGVYGGELAVGRTSERAIPATGQQRAEILGCPIDRLTLEEAVAFCEQVIASNGAAQHLAINVAKLVAIRKDAHLRAVLADCQLVTADGQPVVWASRLLGDPLPARVAGIDLMQELLAGAALKGYPVYVLGAKADILERAIARMREQHPGLIIAGYRHGYYSDEEECGVAAAIAAARPAILLVAMSSPRKEYFLARYRDTMNVPFVMGVGGAIDVVAGVTRRAPVVVQRLGLEWLFRLLQEPRRLFARYLLTNTEFLYLVGRALAIARLSRVRPGTD